VPEQNPVDLQAATAHRPTLERNNVAKQTIIVAKSTWRGTPSVANAAAACQSTKKLFNHEEKQ